MNALRAAIGIAGLALVGLIAWSFLANQDLHGDFGQQFAVLTTLPWGVATLADLYVGFALISVIIFLTERSWITALLWALPIFVLGNLWTAIWLVIRLPELSKRLSQPNWPNS